MRSRTPEQRGWWLPIALLIASLGIAAVAVFQAQRASSTRDATHRRLLTEYGAFAARSFSQRVSEVLRTEIRDILEPVVNPARGARGSVSPAEWFEARFLVHASQFRATAPGSRTARCQDRCVPHFLFRLDIGADKLASIGIAPPDLESIAHAARDHALSFADPYEFRVIRVGARSIAYTMIARRVLYGFELEPTRYFPLYAALGYGPLLLPPSVTRGFPNDQFVRVALIARDSVLFSNGHLSPRATSRALDDNFVGFLVQAEVLPRVEPRLLGATFPPARTELLVAALLLSFGLAIVAALQVRRAAELGRLRADFVASVSHELRTPLAQVQLFLETLRLGRYQTDTQREWILDNMQRETTRLTSIVDNVLQFSRIQRGGEGSARARTDIDTYLQDIVDGYAPLAASRNAQLVASLNAGVDVDVDQEAFRQVMLNLLDNAVKYGPVGQVVTVSASRIGSRVRISVADQGPGIDPSERARIWDPFRRGANAMGTVAVGSGIGLSVVKTVVEEHNGRVSVDGNAEGGARFDVDLPIAEH